MNKWMIFNKNVHVINNYLVTNGHVHVLRSDENAFNIPNGDYDCFYIHCSNSCCLTGLLILGVKKAFPLPKAEHLG